MNAERPSQSPNPSGQRRVHGRVHQSVDAPPSTAVQYLTDATGASLSCVVYREGDRALMRLMSLAPTPPSFPIKLLHATPPFSASGTAATARTWEQADSSSPTTTFPQLSCSRRSFLESRIVRIGSDKASRRSTGTVLRAQARQNRLDAAVLVPVQSVQGHAQRAGVHSPGPHIDWYLGERGGVLGENMSK